MCYTISNYKFVDLYAQKRERERERLRKLWRKNMKKKLLSLVLAICLLLSLVPMQAMATGNGETTDPAPIAKGENCTGNHTGWTKLETTGGNLAAGSYYLNDDVELTSTLNITGTVNLCLNGHDLKLTANSGSVIKIKTSATLNLYDCNGSHARGIRYGRWIEYGEYVAESWRPGGVDYDVITDGMITGGKGTVEDDGTTYGGGVYNGGTFNMYGGSIAGNQADTGGGVSNCRQCAFTMSGGVIAGNTAIGDNGNGGGVYNEDFSPFTMSGGVITGNRASKNGGGVCNSNNECHISGSPIIMGNTNGAGAANNVYLRSGNNIALTDALTDGAAIGVTSQYDFNSGSHFPTIAKGTDTHTDITGDAKYIFSDDATLLAVKDKGTIILKKDVAKSLTDPSAVETGKTYYLEGDLTNNLTIPAGEAVTINLNGHDITNTVTISKGATLNLLDSNGACQTHYARLNADGSYDIDKDTQKDGQKIAGGIITGGISNNGTLNIYGGSIAGNKADQSAGVLNTGILTMSGGAVIGNTATGNGGGVYNGGTFNMYNGRINLNKADQGAGVYNADGGTFTMSGGSITANTAIGDNANGGGVYNGGAFAMHGGIINDDQAYQSGGGVYNSGTFTMSGGSINHNITDESNGAGVCNAKGGTFTMSGGSVTSNEVSEYFGIGGGVYNEGTFNISGKPVIKDNKKSAANNVYLPKGETITLTGALSEGAGIGVSAEIPYSASVIEIATDSKASGDVDQFTSDDNTFGLRRTDAGVIELVTKYTIFFDVQDGDAVDAITALAGTVVENLPDCTRDGWEFLGWYDSTDLTATKIENIEMSEDTTLYAKWQEKEKKPNITINYPDEKLEGFTAEAAYTIAVDGGTAVTVAPAATAIDIADYLGKTLTIVKMAHDEYANSDAQTLTVPARLPAPINMTLDNEGRQILFLTDKQYCTDNGKTWQDCTGDAMTYESFGWKAA